MLLQLYVIFLGACRNSLGHPACPAPKAAVVLSEQQPCADRLQCWGAVSAVGVTAESADEGKEMAQTERGEHLSDYCSVQPARGGVEIRRHNL